MRWVTRFGAAPAFWRILGEIDPAAVAVAAARTVAVVIVGEPGVGRRTLRNQITRGAEHRPSGILVDVSDVHYGLAVDVALLLIDARDPVKSGPLEWYRRHAPRRPIVVVNRVDEVARADAACRQVAAALGISTGEIVSLSANQPGAADRIAVAIARHLTNRALAIGRALPALRPGIARALIRDAALTNGQLALMSALPATVPLLGSLAMVGADTLVLTRNQIVLLFQLAALHDRDLSSRTRLAIELAPLLGATALGGVLMRILARRLPGPLGAPLKGVGSTGGTTVVGAIGLRYYRGSRRPDPVRVRVLAQAGLKRAMPLLRRAGRVAAGLVRRAPA